MVSALATCDTSSSPYVTPDGMTKLNMTWATVRGESSLRAVGCARENGKAMMRKICGVDHASKMSSA